MGGVRVTGGSCVTGRDGRRSGLGWRAGLAGLLGAGLRTRLG